MHVFPSLQEYLLGKPRTAQTPVDQTEDVEESGVVSMKIDGNHRHFQLSDEAGDSGLPFTVADMEGFVDL